ncbi:MAG: GTPase, partial [Chloroflexi bacterium RBG_16_57_9]
MNELVERALAGERRATARLLTVVETGGPGAREALARLYPRTGQAHIIGVTGAPGAGKSSLVNAMTRAYRARGLTIGVIAVDPTSPFTGGAILGDRIRMQDLHGDTGVFIRSMATRGSLGGLAWATRDAIKVLDAVGYQIVIVETVGAGQSEVDIAAAADTTIVVTVPGLGDDIQAIKAGILEIADVFAVNKADREGADTVVAQLRTMLSLGASRPRQMWHHGVQVDVPAESSTPSSDHRWTPPICKTIAVKGEGVLDLLKAVDAHRAHLAQSGEGEHRDRARVRSEFLDLLRHTLLEHLMAQVSATEIERLVDRVVQRELDPYA